MANSATTAVGPPKPAGLGTLFLRRGLIGGAGIFSVVAVGFIGFGSIATHTTYWEGQVDCSASIGASPLFRYSIIVGALAAATAITVTLIRIATRPAPQTRAVVAYWIATVSLWMMLAATFVVGFSVEVNLCRRGLSP